MMNDDAKQHVIDINQVFNLMDEIELPMELLFIALVAQIMGHATNRGLGAEAKADMIDTINLSVDVCKPRFSLILSKTITVSLIE